MPLVSKLRAHLSFANVASVIALFAALGLGTAWALEANSVRSKHIVNGQVKKRDLGVPAKYTPAGLVDRFGSCPDGTDQWMDATAFNEEVGFYRDPFGIVHLRGTALRCGSVSSTIFSLPPGHRPEDIVDEIGARTQTEPQSVRILASGEVASTFASGTTISLEGISFRCTPSGLDGCP